MNKAERDEWVKNNPFSDELYPAIFLDRDGTINYNYESGLALNNDPDFPWHVLNWEEFEFLPGVIDAFGILHDMHMKVFVVSNQPSIGEGIARYYDIKTVFDYMATKIFERTNRYINYEFCRHAANTCCTCRKPNPGLLYSVAYRASIDPFRSYIVGDSPSDMEAGARFGIPYMNRIQIPWIPEQNEPIRINDTDVVSRKASGLLEAVKLIKMEEENKCHTQKVKNTE